jgi:hypothetical protein
LNVGQRITTKGVHLPKPEPGLFESMGRRGFECHRDLLRMQEDKDAQDYPSWKDHWSWVARSMYVELAKRAGAKVETITGSS